MAHGFNEGTPTSFSMTFRNGITAVVDWSPETRPPCLGAAQMVASQDTGRALEKVHELRTAPTFKTASAKAFSPRGDVTRTVAPLWTFPDDTAKYLAPEEIVQFLGWCMHLDRRLESFHAPEE